MSTRTGKFPIGFRRGWTEWQKDLSALAQWAKTSGFEALDLGNADERDLEILRNAGLRLGSCDLLEFGNLLSSDPGRRRDAISANIASIDKGATLGAKVYFTCVIPGDETKSRRENYALAVECYAPIVEKAASVGAAVVIEGWPGGAPAYSNLCCTPETYRRFIKDLGGKGIGVNYDPSHLIRLGVDHIRFLKEFVPYVYHVHAKDTEIDTEAIYEYGLYQGSAFTDQPSFGESTWRYTIPGHGVARWSEIFRLLEENGYQGVVSVELEDANFWGTPQAEKDGYLQSLSFLRGA